MRFWRRYIQATFSTSYPIPSKHLSTDNEFTKTIFACVTNQDVRGVGAQRGASLFPRAFTSRTNSAEDTVNGNTKKDKIQQTPSSTLKNKVEARPRKVKSSLKNKDCIVAPKGTAHVQHFKLNANYELKCVKITTTTEVPLRKSSALDNKTPKPVVTLVYSRKPRRFKTSVPVNNYKVVPICSFVKFGNDHVAKIMGYGDYQIGNVTISMVYYVEGLGHNLFSVGQFCDSNLEVAFRQHTCYIRNLEGVDLLTGSRGDNIYTLSLGDMMASSPI
ncbi:hypothetical protein Tco_0962477, partial [Tanacetum coccineum]